MIGSIVNEAKNVQRTRERQRIDENIDLPEHSARARGTIEQALLDALEEAKSCLTPEEREVVELKPARSAGLLADTSEMSAPSDFPNLKTLARSGVTGWISTPGNARETFPPWMI